MIKIFFTTKYTKKHEDFFILISLRDLPKIFLSLLAFVIFVVR